MDNALQDVARLLGVFGVLGIGAVFLIMGFIYRPKKLSVTSYLKSNNDLHGNECSDSFFAAGFSLAGNILFFTQCYKLYGWLMAVGPMFVLIVQIGIAKFLHRISFNFNKIGTIAELCYDAFPSTTIAKIIAIMCAFSSLMLLFVEIYMGSAILSVFFPATLFYDFFAFAILGMIVLGYVYWGGLKAVVKTDVWQLILILIFCLAFVYYAITMPSNATFSDLSMSGVIHKMFSFSEQGLTLYIFITWVIFINITWMFSNITAWQRMAAATSMYDVYMGLLKGSWKMITIFWVPVLCFILVALKSRDYNTMPEFLNIVLEYSDKTGVILFPLIVIGFASALFSTADTTLIGVIYALCDKHTFLPKLESIDIMNNERIMKRYLLIFFILILIGLSLLYALNKSKIASLALPVMYSVWGLITVFVPLVVYSLLKSAGKVSALVYNKKNNLFLMIGLFLGYVAILSGTLLEIITGKQIFPQIAVFVGTGVFSLSLLVVARESKKYL